MAEKIYCRGKAEAKETKYGSLFIFSLNVNELQEHANEDGRVNLAAGKRKEVGQYGDTHSIWINNLPKENENKDISEVPDF